MEDWPSGGLVQTSNALLLEALRQEAYIMAITLISQGKKPDDLTAEDLSERVQLQLSRMVGQVAVGVAEETLTKIRS